MYLAAVLYKDGRRSTSMVPAEKALEMATIDGARAVGLESEIRVPGGGKEGGHCAISTPAGRNGGRCSTP